MSARAWLITTAVLLAGGRLSYAQAPVVTGYYQNAPLWAWQTDASERRVSDFSRFRLATEPVFGRFSIEAAYEQVLTLRQDEADAVLVGQVPGGGEWLELQWTIADDEHVLWQHRFDRLKVGWRPNDQLELSVGRQAVSWATTLFFSPSDPFSPFSPADPFREFRLGVDAARLRAYPGPLTELDAVVRPTTNRHLGEETTALVRALTAFKGWEVSVCGGSLYGDMTAAFGAAGALGPLAVRGEGVVRRVDEETILRGAIGVDRQMSVAGKDLYAALEYQHDGLGAARADEYARVARSDPFLRGELQALGRDETAFQASCQVHPLLSVAAMWMWNLNDGSTLVSPSVAYSAGDEISVTGGLYFGFGDDDGTADRPIPSEYGASGTTAFASVSWFF